MLAGRPRKPILVRLQWPLSPFVCGARELGQEKTLLLMGKWAISAVKGRWLLRGGLFEVLKRQSVIVTS